MRWIGWFSILGLAAAQVSERCTDRPCPERRRLGPADDVNDTALHLREDWSLRRSPKCHSKRCCAVDLENVPRTPDVVSVGSLRFPTSETEPYGASGVTVCYPNAQKFVECRIWQLLSADVRRDGNAIVDVASGARHELGEYVAVNGTFWVCVPPGAIAYNDFRNSLVYGYVIEYAISIVSLVATFVVQVSSKERFTNQKAVLLSHVASLFIGYTTLLVQCLIQLNEAPSYAVCFATGLLMQFSFLAACTWLTTPHFGPLAKIRQFPVLGNDE